MSEVILKVENVSKSFNLKVGRNTDIREELIDAVKSVFTKNKKPTNTNNQFWALQNINFEVKQGEILGIIGANGAGKSTLLKLLSQISKPDTGSIWYKGEFIAILDIGAGLHPDLSGRDNVFLKGSLLGLNQQEIENIYPQIIAFSELEDFIHVPVKNYSNGMFLRLAFSIAFHLKVDILLLDEVLSVGDASFKRKCFLKIQELARNGTTILLVSHNANEVLDLCKKVMLIEKGKVIALGNTYEIVEGYLQQSVQQEGNNDDTAKIENDFFRLIDVTVKAVGKQVSDIIYMEDAVEIAFTIDKKINEHSLELILIIYDIADNRIIADSAAFRKSYKIENMALGRYKYKVKIPSNFFNHSFYNTSITICKNKDFIGEWQYVKQFKIHPNIWEVEQPYHNLSTSIRPHFDWSIHKK